MSRTRKPLANPFGSNDPVAEVVADFQRALRLQGCDAAADARWLLDLVASVRDLQRKAAPGIPNSRRRAEQAERRLDNFLHEWREAVEARPLDFTRSAEGGAA
ncbi:MAG: hypothetical protein KF873_02140 [Gemmataceae bacterium]|nr:hypothetical protein [Gemmataceae bacterium]